MECDSRLNNWAYNNDMNSIGINSFLKDTKRIVSSLLDWCFFLQSVQMPRFIAISDVRTDML